MTTRVEEIWQEFLAPGAQSAINLDSHSYEKTSQNVKDPGRYTYEDAQVSFWFYGTTANETLSFNDISLSHCHCSLVRKKRCTVWSDFEDIYSGWVNYIFVESICCKRLRLLWEQMFQNLQVCKALQAGAMSQRKHRWKSAVQFSLSLCTTCHQSLAYLQHGWCHIKILANTLFL